MKDEFFYEPPAAQQLRRGKHMRPFLRSAIVTCLFLAGAAATTMILSPSRTSSLLGSIVHLLSASGATSHPCADSPVVADPLLSSNTDHVGYGRHAAISSESSVCSGIGRALFLAGGNAADAIVGTTFCVGVIGMYHSGIGGGGFMLVRGADGEYENIDFRETAPAAAWQDMYKHDVESSIFGGLASGVPGEVRGLAHLHSKYGKLAWRDVMQGAIGVARDGFPVTADLVRYMAAATTDSSDPNSSFLVKDPDWAVDFAPNGTLLQLGDTITRKRYASTLEEIAEKGPDAFYTGPQAEAMIAAVQAANGTMTLSDLANYSVAIRPAAETTYRNYTLRSVSAPASGTVTLSILKILEGYPDIGGDMPSASLNLSTHRLDEAMRFGYGQRTQLGDPSFLPDMASYESELLSAETAKHIRSKIADDRTFNISHYDPAGFEIKDTPGTSHVVAADASGLAISLTTTINLLFGSRVMVPATGVIMNNEMNDFSIPGTKNAFGFVPSPANYIRPGKRPLSSIACTIVEHTHTGGLFFVTGSAGGSKIITATLLSLWAVLDRGMRAAEALAMPRLHDQLVPDVVTFEHGYDEATVAFMKGLGHNVAWVAPGLSTAQCLRVDDDGVFEAASEPRQKNSAAFAV